MNLFKGSYKSLSIKCGLMRKRAIRKSHPYLKSKAIEITSDNPQIHGKWNTKRLVKNLKTIKYLIINEKDKTINLSLLKGYSNLVTPETKSFYKRKRTSGHSKLEYKVPCFVCKENDAYCNHHIHLLVNGGVDSEYNLIPICKSCHKEIHSWLFD